MQEINYLNTLTAISNAISTPNLHIGIFMDSYDKAKHKFEEVVDEINKKDRDFVSHMRKGHANIVEFKNGSYIKVLKATESARGYAFHQVLYDRNIIDEDILYGVIRPTEKLQWRV